MIHLFRKIRFDNLKKSRFKKYILYASGEILLVVIGILLALQFNNWNQQRANSEKEEWYLINIVEDIEYQKSDLKDMKENYKLSIKLCKDILKQYHQKGSFSKVDSLNEKINVLLVADNFPNINNTYQELVNSGQQNIIKSKDISLDVIDYFLFCNDNEIDFTNNNNNIYYKEIYPVFSALTQLSLVDFEWNEEDSFLLENDLKTKIYLNKKLDEPEHTLQLLNALKTQIAINTIHLEMVIETLEIGKELVQKIDDYLGLTPDMVNHYD